MEVLLGTGDAGPRRPGRFRSEPRVSSYVSHETAARRSTRGRGDPSSGPGVALSSCIVVARVMLCPIGSFPVTHRSGLSGPPISRQPTGDGEEGNTTSVPRGTRRVLRKGSTEVVGCRSLSPDPSAFSRRGLREDSPRHGWWVQAVGASFGTPERCPDTYTAACVPRETVHPPTSRQVSCFPWNTADGKCAAVQLRSLEWRSCRPGRSVRAQEGGGTP